MLTTQQVADLHGVSRSRIYRIAKARGIKPEGLAEPAGKGRPTRMWTREQAQALKPGRCGRPRLATECQRRWLV